MASSINPFMTAPFTPVGTVSRSVNTGSQRVALSRAYDQTCIITAPTGNSGPVFIKFGDSTVEAAATDFPILPGTIQTFHVLEQWTHVAAIMASGTGTIYASVGDGI
jgi:hypothetical protein